MFLMNLIASMFYFEKFRYTYFKNPLPSRRNLDIKSETTTELVLSQNILMKIF